MSERAGFPKKCLVTGATNGLGRAIAEQLLARGAHVILVGRTLERTVATADELRRTTGSDRIEWALADLSVQADVRRLAADIAHRHGAIDVLINNAGTIQATRRLTADGFELTWAVNYLAPFLLTNLLVDRLQAAKEPRIVNIVSIVHRWGHICFEDLSFDTRPFGSMKAYAQSKLALVLFTVELAKRAPWLSVNCIHPGGIRSNLAAELRPADRFLGKLMWPILDEPEVAADGPVYLAESAEVLGVTGQYLVKRKVRPKNLAGLPQDPDARAVLWRASEAMTDLAAR